MLNIKEKYIFSPTICASQSRNMVVLGAGIEKDYSINMETVKPAVLAALDRLDGQHTLHQLTDGMDRQETADFLGLVEFLYKKRTIELASERSDAVQRSKEQGVDYERFDRQINLFRFATGTYEEALNVQERLHSAKVALVGLGGCGSYIFYTLSAMGIGSLNVFEFDRVERSNLTRQILYGHNDIGRLKIDVAEEKAASISPTTKFSFFNKKIETQEDAEQCFEGVDLLICAADNPRPEFFHLMNEACFRAGVPMMYAGSCTTTAVVGPLLVPGKTRCVRCINDFDQPDRADRYEFVNRTSDAYVTTLIDPYNATAGSLSALEAVKFLTGFQECQVLGRRLVMSFSDYAVHRTEGHRSGHCPICS